jgi:hypothetical protein
MIVFFECYETIKEYEVIGKDEVYVFQNGLMTYGANFFVSWRKDSGLLGDNTVAIFRVKPKPSFPDVVINNALKQTA